MDTGLVIALIGGMLVSSALSAYAVSGVVHHLITVLAEIRDALVQLVNHASEGTENLNALNARASLVARYLEGIRDAAQYRHDESISPTTAKWMMKIVEAYTAKHAISAEPRSAPAVIQKLREDGKGERIGYPLAPAQSNPDELSVEEQWPPPGVIAQPARD